MAKPLRPKRGTTAKNDAFVGLASEITIDTDKHSIRVHDGITVGGHEILPKAKNDELYGKQIRMSGNRGEIGGYNTPKVYGMAMSVNGDSNDDTQFISSAAFSVANGTAGTAWTKAVWFTQAMVDGITLGSSWNWAGGEVPTIDANSVLVLYWNNDRGLANLIKGGE